MTLDEEGPVITLRIQNHFSGKTRYAEVSYEDLTPRTLKKCVTKNGGAPTDWKDLYNMLMQDIKMGMQQKLFESMYGYTKLGWIKKTDGLAFYCQNVISSNNQSSKYMGQVDIEPKGTLDNIVK